MHDGKTYIVTGVASGIGAETCAVLKAQEAAPTRAHRRVAGPLLGPPR